MSKKKTRQAQTTTSISRNAKGLIRVIANHYDDLALPEVVTRKPSVVISAIVSEYFDKYGLLIEADDDVLKMKRALDKEIEYFESKDYRKEREKYLRKKNKEILMKGE